LYDINNRHFSFFFIDHSEATNVSKHRGSEVSGGGSRAFAYSMGVYRALHELQLIPRLDAISSAARSHSSGRADEGR
jgi:hypothetical protein